MSEPIDTTNNERLRDAITLAKNQRNNGASLESIESRLRSRGFDDRAIKAVLDQVPKAEPNNIIVKPPAEPGRKVLILIGFTISALGLVLVFGNVTGLGTSMPYFGFAIMMLGGVITATGRS